jgi:hypothetical protein
MLKRETCWSRYWAMKLRLFTFIMGVSIGVMGCNALSSSDVAPNEMPTTLFETATIPAELEGDLLLPTLTSTPAPASDSTQTPTAIPPTTAVTPTKTIQPRAEGDSPQSDPVIYKYGIQTGSPLIIQAWSHDCDWMGIGGQVFDIKGQPVVGVIVEVGGRLNGQSIFGLSITGIDSGYGPGGYEIQLADEPINSDLETWIQLKDASGQSVSPQVYLQTFDTCLQNLILLNFVATERPEPIIFYFPLIFK